MRSLDAITKEELIDLLNRCWMTHDGMWFYHCVQEFGIEKANKLNKAAIKALAPLETARMRKVFGIDKDKIVSFRELEEFFTGAAKLFIPDFMNARMSMPSENVLRWEFVPKNCFAYKGMNRIGVVDRYECGVIYRIMCWLDSLGVRYTVQPPVGGCVMRDQDECSGEFKFTF